jgi:hypothetical protein
MATILLNNSGAPVISKTGKIPTITRTDELRQRIKIVLSTREGTRIIFPKYGMNVDMLYINKKSETKRDIVKSMVLEAISPNNIYGIDWINDVEVEIEGQTAYIYMDIQSTDGNVRSTLEVST